MIAFAHNPLAIRAVFNIGAAARLPGELSRLDAKRVLFVTTPAGAHRYQSIVASARESVAVRVFGEAASHTPLLTAEAALAAYTDFDADAVVTIGGGSTIGVGKFIASRSDARFLAMPTTPSGSEMTPLYGFKTGDEKRTARDPRAAPKTVIYDPVLTVSLPVHETATIAMNCLAHCVEALYPQEPDPIAFFAAQEGVRALLKALPACLNDPSDLEARAGMLYGGFLGGLCVALVGVALHHKICHILGGHFGVAHGASNSVILPYALAYNAPATPNAIRALKDIFNSEDPAAALFDFARAIGAPRSLGELGMDSATLAACCAEVLAASFYNPRPLDRAGLEQLLADAFVGRRPSSQMSANSTQSLT